MKRSEKTCKKNAPLKLELFAQSCTEQIKAIRTLCPWEQQATIKEIKDITTNIEFWSYCQNLHVIVPESHFPGKSTKIGISKKNIELVDNKKDVISNFKFQTA